MYFVKNWFTFAAFELKSLGWLELYDFHLILCCKGFKEKDNKLQERTTAVLLIDNFLLQILRILKTVLSRVALGGWVTVLQNENNIELKTKIYVKFCRYNIQSA